MRRTVLGAATLLLAGLAAGCGAARPAKYYQLQNPSNAVAAASNAYPVSLLVGALKAPHLYRDTRIVYFTGNMQLGTYEYDRWAEPPTEMIEAKLVNALRATGQYQSVEHVSSKARGDYIIRGRLDALEEVDSPAFAGRFTIELELYYPKTGMTVWAQTYTHDEPVNERKKMYAVVEALDRNVQQGVTQLVAGIGQFIASHPQEK